MKPESAFIESVHDHLPHRRKFYRLKNQHQLTSGVADVWYSGLKADWWVEYKWVVLPKKDAWVELTITDLQLDWLQGRYEEQRRVAVIVGFNMGRLKHGVVVTHRAWADNALLKRVMLSRAKQTGELALWLMDQCLTGSYKHSVEPIAG